MTQNQIERGLNLMHLKSFDLANEYKQRNFSLYKNEMKIVLSSGRWFLK